MSAFGLHAWVCTTSTQCRQESEEASDSLELEVQGFVNRHVDAGN